jgi:methylenetetrahydrofolate dehydrogenase (NADP+)/methenyltetrahydrofolate cyclohydrolase
MIVNGKAISKELLAQVRTEVTCSGKKPIIRAITVRPSPATASYMRIKARRAVEAGMQLTIIALADTATTDDCIQAIKEGDADAVIVQLPLPETIDTARVLAALPPGKDADVLNRDTSTLLLPPVVGAVREILERAGVSPSGKRAVVIGNGWLVGQPVRAWLAAAGAEVVTLMRDSDNWTTVLKEADIIVSGAGVPGLIKPEHLTEGVVLIDAGTSESDGALVGDADPLCATVAGVFTPVPGGVGPIAVACLMRNVVELPSLQGTLKAV